MSEYLSEGYIWDQNTGAVEKLGAENAVAQVGEQYFASLGAAIAAVPDNDTETAVTLLKDAAGGGVQVKEKQKILLDLNGNTYTVGQPTVGYAGTETNGFH